MWVGNQVGIAGIYHPTPLWQQTSLVMSLGPQACFPVGDVRVGGWTIQYRGTDDQRQAYLVWAAWRRHCIVVECIWLSRSQSYHPQKGGILLIPQSWLGHWDVTREGSDATQAPAKSEFQSSLTLSQRLQTLLTSEHILSSCCMSGTPLDTFLPSFHPHNYLMDRVLSSP